ncbi:MAG: Bor protein [Bacteroidales bacterium]
MKSKTFIISALLCASFTLTSCFSTKLYVGDIEKKDPVVKVYSEWNHHLIGGLVPVGNNEMKTSDYVKDAPDYMVKTNRTFLDFLISGVTCGIYTPSHTTYYLPMNLLTK